MAKTLQTSSHYCIFRIKLSWFQIKTDKRITDPLPRAFMLKLFLQTAFLAFISKRNLTRIKINWLGFVSSYFLGRVSGRDKQPNQPIRRQSSIRDSCETNSNQVFSQSFFLFCFPSVVKQKVWISADCLTGAFFPPTRGLPEWITGSNVKIKWKSVPSNPFSWRWILQLKLRVCFRPLTREASQWP